MVLRSQENSIGAWAFLIGVVLALFIGIITIFLSAESLISYSKYLLVILVILGVIVGIMIYSGKESQTFLVTAMVLVIVSKFGMESLSGSLIGIGLNDAVVSIFSALLALFVPTTIIVAIKTVFSITSV